MEQSPKEIERVQERELAYAIESRLEGQMFSTLETYIGIRADKFPGNGGSIFFIIEEPGTNNRKSASVRMYPEEALRVAEAILLTLSKSNPELLE